MPLPSVILGHANGKIKGGQHLKYPQDSRHGELLLTLLQRNEIPVKSIGDEPKAFPRSSNEDHGDAAFQARCK